MLHAHTKQLESPLTVSNEIDPEVQLIHNLVETVAQAGIGSDPIAVINFYIALKTKPLAILAGPAETGKLALVQCLARSLTDGGCDQCQFLSGHPWNAGSSANLAFFTDLHTRYNSEKLLCLIEEAWRPENSGKVYIACLAHISRAEVATLFSEFAFQVRRGYIMQFGDIHFSKPLPYPPNLFLVGTMDTPRFDQWDTAMLSAATIIAWDALGGSIFCPGTFPTPASRAGRHFLAASIRSLGAVYRKLHDLLSWDRHPMEPFFLLEDALSAGGVRLPQTAVQEAMTYVANAWSSTGEGLFDSDLEKNLKIATDMAIAQTLLPLAADDMQRAPDLRNRVEAILDSHYPNSTIMLTNLARDRAWQTIPITANRRSFHERR